MITPEHLDRIGRLVQGQGLDEAAIRALRRDFPDLHFTWCMDDEVGGIKPVRELDGCNLYLVDGRHHCLRFTADAAAATGLVLTTCNDDN